MNTDSHRLAGSRREGFTLIEVLFAMVILAVGLLALESMAIGASRMVARADRQSVYTSLAAEELEQALATFQNGDAVVSRARTVDGITVSRVVTPRPAPVGNTAITVDVQVDPPAGTGLVLQPVRMVGHAYR